MKTRSLQLSDVVTTAGTQIRAKIDTETVDEYAHAMLDGAQFPPVVVFHDGSEFILADGFHRVMAAVRNGFKDIEADVRKGTKSDALKYALGANATHGVKRTNADKRRSVDLALGEWPQLSDNKLAEICAVSQNFVSAFRRELKSDVSSDAPRIGRDGKTRKLPAKKQKPSPKPEDRPHIVAEPIGKTFAQEATEEFKKLVPNGDEDPFLDALIKAWDEAPKTSRTAFLAYIK